MDLSRHRHPGRSDDQLGDVRSDARELAMRVLTRFEDGRLVRLGEGIDAEAASLDERERGLARELVLGVVRHERLYDTLADNFLRQEAQPTELRLALRLGAHQLFGMDRIPPHAAVSATVSLLRHGGQQRLAGVANAVLRRLAHLRREERSCPGPIGRLAPEDLPENLALRHSLPDRLLRELVGAGQTEEGRLAALNLVPALCTRLRPNVIAPEHADVLRHEGEWLWWRNPASALRGPVAEGLCVVQDAAQGRAMDLAGFAPGERVLDCCAAPGGKSLLLHDHGCSVVASDRSAEKCEAMRACLPVAIEVVHQDGRAPRVKGPFDVVLVDAPCSNSGVFGRRPEAKRRYDAAHLQSLMETQRDILHGVAPLIRTGGRLVYSTCSISPHENHAVARSVAGWRIAQEETTWPDGWTGGGYVAVLVRE